ncbi:acyl-CoA dehydrogenase [Leptospira interrogans]|uniref:acyl-CoA dehydrogenase n=1 Tax=Leptospira interrogans TaxID=173 RepID=UPI0010C01BC2|nr:acyl-CoA dehydrogenase [Leptospira interrogans]KAA1267165.1 acyl-CoA dehydrogenase [Leptospira interrogans serovar Weerasinghe]KAA1292230.1 acyl-CoA dehydrogenase [Leptospira interrogans serovar Geyaweera]QCO37441.1 acyl-CoA dehydrogenase [Leptospira interrogans]QCO41047.1 acyl-CoA dehydrogenase [Leptospira interrogans]ULG79787.1 acyl-CoA dehydrogenase [Leptospira interrogans]
MSLKEYLSSIPPNEYRNVFKDSFPYLIEEGYLEALAGGSFETFHQKIYQLGSYPRGIGLGIAVMAQTNVAGRILKFVSGGFLNENTIHKIFQKEEAIQIGIKLLNDISLGKNIVSMGVSETGWKGRISNILTSYRIENERIILNLSKSFLTNGANCSGFLIVSKSPSETFDIIYLPRDSEGLDLEIFDLEYAKEATHCRLKGNDLSLPLKNLIFLNYQNFAPDIHLSEMLSASALFCGYVDLIVKTLLKEKKDIDPRIAGKILDIQQLLYSKILEISRKKDQNPDFRMEEVHPYGYETALDLIYSWFTDLVSGVELSNMFPDIGLFYSIHPGKTPIYQKNILKKIRALR